MNRRATCPGGGSWWGWRCTTPFLALCALVAGLGLQSARADTFTPAAGAAGPSSLAGFVESPAQGQAVTGSGTFVVRGWVVDLTAAGWSGVDRVEVYDGSAEAGGRLLAVGLAGDSRPDVATVLGNPYWGRSGFTVAVNADDLPWGSRTLSVYAVTPGRGRWLLPVTVTKRADTPSPSDRYPDEPRIRLIDPLPAEILRGGQRVMRGTALDRNALNAGSGVDRVEVYTAARESGGTLLGIAQLGKLYGEPGYELSDPAFNRAGWDLLWDPRLLGAGEREVWVYAHRTGTNVWNATRVPVTVAP